MIVLQFSRQFWTCIKFGKGLVYWLYIRDHKLRQDNMTVGALSPFIKHFTHVANLKQTHCFSSKLVISIHTRAHTQITQTHTHTHTNSVQLNESRYAFEIHRALEGPSGNGKNHQRFLRIRFYRLPVIVWNSEMISARLALLAYTYIHTYIHTRTQPSRQTRWSTNRLSGDLLHYTYQHINEW